MSEIHGAICEDCAKKKGWTMHPEHRPTGWACVCPYCLEEKGVCDETDYLWNDRRGK